LRVEYINGHLRVVEDVFVLACAVINRHQNMFTVELLPDADRVGFAFGRDGDQRDDARLQDGEDRVDAHLGEQIRGGR
jgi:hypothetical protein